MKYFLKKLASQETDCLILGRDVGQCLNALRIGLLLLRELSGYILCRLIALEKE